MAETNRTPFDFSEGESELVSGFNIEYGAGGFALIFMAEYASILLMRALCVSLALGANIRSSAGVLGLLILAGVWVWLRATLPRYRYDFLINLAWKRLLPEALLILSFISSIVILV